MHESSLHPFRIAVESKKVDGVRRYRITGVG